MTRTPTRPSPTDPSSGLDLPAALALFGAVVVSVGAGLYHLGLGLIVLGAFLVAGAFLIARVPETASGVDESHHEGPP